MVCVGVGERGKGCGGPYGERPRDLRSEGVRTGQPSTDAEIIH